MNVISVQILITKQDWENFTYYCQKTNISKFKAISIILNNWLEKYNIYHDIINDFEINLMNYNHQQFIFKQDYNNSLIRKTIKIYEFLWQTYTNFCKVNDYAIFSLLNIIINTFLYLDFPTIEIANKKNEEKDNFTYVYNEDGSLKYKTNKNIKGNQA